MEPSPTPTSTGQPFRNYMRCSGKHPTFTQHTRSPSPPPLHVSINPLHLSEALRGTHVGATESSADKLDRCPNEALMRQGEKQVKYAQYISTKSAISPFQPY